MANKRNLPAGEVREFRMQRLLELFGVTELPSHKFALVSHEFVDTDGLESVWAVRTPVIMRLFPDAECKVVLVPAGALNEDTRSELLAEGYNVIPVDVGRGIFDQHGRGMRYGSSLELVVDYFDLWNEPGIPQMVNLARATDNIDEVDPMSIHHAFSSLPYQYTQEGGEIDWDEFINASLKILDGFYYSSFSKAESRRMWGSMGEKMTMKLLNGFKIAQLSNYPRLRESAYKTGADCVVFFDDQHFNVTDAEVDPDHAYCVGISLHRKYRYDSNVSLHEVVAALRVKEAEKRGVNVDGIDLTQSERIPGLAPWYLLGAELDKGRFNSGNLVLCGSRSRPIKTGDDVTYLTRHEIYKTVRDVLGQFPPMQTPKQKPAHKPTPAKKTAPETVVKTTAMATKTAPKIKAKKETRRPVGKKAAKKAVAKKLASKDVRDAIADKGWKFSSKKAKIKTAAAKKKVAKAKTKKKK